MDNNSMNEAREKGMTYIQFRNLMEEVVSRHATTGPDQSAKMVEYTALNWKRMQRWDKAVLQPETLALAGQVKRSMLWVLLAEAWCGDVAQNLSLISKIADAAPRIELRILLRDEHLDIMDKYLTNGGRAIPKLIALDAATGEELAQWGPRPAPVQEMVWHYKAQPEPKPDYADFAENVHRWYAQDKGKTLQAEMREMLRPWTKSN